MGSIERMLRKAEEAFGPEVLRIERETGSYLRDSVSPSRDWPFGTYETRDGITMRKVPEAFRDLIIRDSVPTSISAFLRLSEKAFNIASPIGVHHASPASEASKGWLPSYYGGTSESQTKNPDVPASLRAFSGHTLGRDRQRGLATERLISRTIDRAEALGIALTNEAMEDMERRAFRAGMEASRS